jgi:CRP-like cAMP-binding protein
MQCTALVAQVLWSMNAMSAENASGVWQHLAVPASALHVAPTHMCSKSREDSMQWYRISVGKRGNMHPEWGSGRRRLARLRAGQQFGEQACWTGCRRTASVVTITQCELYCLSRNDLLHLTKEWPELADDFKEGAPPHALSIHLHVCNHELA